MRKSVSAAAVCFTLFCCLPSMSHAQFWARILNPRVTVDMRHPPAFGLDLETVVFGPASGECADEIIQSLIASLLADEINVVNRQEADLILGEHQLSESGWVLPESRRGSRKTAGAIRPDRGECGPLRHGTTAVVSRPRPQEEGSRYR